MNLLGNEKTRHEDGEWLAPLPSSCVNGAREHGEAAEYSLPAHTRPVLKEFWLRSCAGGIARLLPE